jgi:hypothetical protein
LWQALKILSACEPSPAETLVHIDAGDRETAPMLDREFAGRVTWMQSKTTQGPGGGRNILLRRAKFSLVASFDDDSWPLDVDYFAMAVKLMAANPQAGVLTGQITLRGEIPTVRLETVRPVASFEGGACVYRREAFLATCGYIPLRYSYGMEEVDVALQLMDARWSILQASSLRVFHDSALQHHVSPQINAAHITNTALLVYLRYPICYWPLGLFQVLNRVRFALTNKRTSGLVAGLMGITPALWRYRSLRTPVKSSTISLSRRRRHEE